MPRLPIFFITYEPNERYKVDVLMEEPLDTWKTMVQIYFPFFKVKLNFSIATNAKRFP